MIILPITEMCKYDILHCSIPLMANLFFRHLGQVCARCTMHLHHTQMPNDNTNTNINTNINININTNTTTTALCLVCYVSRTPCVVWGVLIGGVGCCCRCSCYCVPLFIHATPRLSSWDLSCQI